MTTWPDSSEGPVTRRFALPAAAHSPRQARHRLAGLLDQLGMNGELADVALLLTNELVTNAVLHGSGEPVVEIRVYDRRLWIGVEDADSASTPQPRRAGSDALSGRGLLLVDALAQSWGTTVTASKGKTVWFTLARAPG